MSQPSPSVKKAMEDMMDIGLRMANLARIQAEISSTIANTQFTEHQKKIQAARLLAENEKFLTEVKTKLAGIRQELMDAGISLGKVDVSINMIEDIAKRMREEVFPEK